jgi:ABC-2 type transport system permease protein
MNGYASFTKKEFTENIRNYRMLILLAIFFIFGVTGPLTAKFTPQIIEAIAPSMQLAFEEPTALDSWVQFYKNISQLGFSLMIILFSNTLSGEYSKGTLTIMLTKGLSRTAVILSKFSASAGIMTLSYWLCFGISYGYTAFLWPGAELPHVFFAAFALWVAGLLYLCILMLGCVLFRQAFTAIMFLLVVTVAINLLGLGEKFAPYSPFFLASANVGLLSGSVALSQFAVPFVISVLMSSVLLFVSIVVFYKKQL